MQHTDKLHHKPLEGLPWYFWYPSAETTAICHPDEKYNAEKRVWNVKMFTLINKSYTLLCTFVSYVEKGKYVPTENRGHI